MILHDYFFPDVWKNILLALEKERKYFISFSDNVYLRIITVCKSLNLSTRTEQTRRSILGSGGMTLLLSGLWVPSEYSLSTLWVLS